MANPQAQIIVTYVKETTGKKHCRQVTIIRNQSTIIIQVLRRAMQPTKPRYPL